MKNFKTILASLSTAALMTAMALNFNACTEQSPLQSTNISDNDTLLLSKRANSYPQYDEHTINLSSYNKKTGTYIYSGGNLQVTNRSTFHVTSGSLTPPAELLGDAVTITMLVEKDEVNNQLIFTFGPSGCSFSPGAEVWLDWSDLGISAPKLYYVESNGNYIEQAADSIDLQGQRLSLHIDHFSRYAIGTE